MTVTRQPAGPGERGQQMTVTRQPAGCRVVGEAQLRGRTVHNHRFAIRVASRLTGQDGVTTLLLGRLDDDAVAALAAGYAGDRPVPRDVMRTLIEQAQGLPLLVQELLSVCSTMGRPDYALAKNG